MISQHGSDDGWKQSTNLVSGVNWAKSKTAVTLGIWMWNRPFILTGWTGDKVKRWTTSDHAIVAYRCWLWVDLGIPIYMYIVTVILSRETAIIEMFIYPCIANYTCSHLHIFMSGSRISHDQEQRITLTLASDEFLKVGMSCIDYLCPLKFFVSSLKWMLFSFS